MRSTTWSTLLSEPLRWPTTELLLIRALVESSSAKPTTTEAATATATEHTTESAAKSAEPTTTSVHAGEASASAAGTASELLELLHHLLLGLEVSLTPAVLWSEVHRVHAPLRPELILADIHERECLEDAELVISLLEDLEHLFAVLPGDLGAVLRAGYWGVVPKIMTRLLVVVVVCYSCLRWKNFL